MRENIAWTPIDYFNNKIVCELIEGQRPPGVFAVLDDACATATAESDAADRSFLQRLGSCTGHAHFDLRANGFCVRHYAGDVNYEAQGMTDRNRDTIPQDLVTLFGMSTNAFLTGLNLTELGEATKERKKTAGARIRVRIHNSLTLLLNG